MMQAIYEVKLAFKLCRPAQVGLQIPKQSAWHTPNKLRTFWIQYVRFLADCGITEYEDDSEYAPSRLCIISNDAPIKRVGVITASEMYHH